MPVFTHGGQDIENCFGEPCAKLHHTGPKLSCKQFTSIFFCKFLILSTGKPHQRLPAKIANKWRYKLSRKKYDTTFEQSVLCQLYFLC